jgi:Fur family peroxide stress response transcriptional regulator
MESYSDGILMPNWTKRQIIEVLREKGLKVTTQRLAICQILFSSDLHPTAEQIYEKIVDLHPTISRATIYKTITKLQKKGLIQE